MQRIIVFLHYDPDGRVDSGVRRLLGGLRPFASRLLVVSNGELTQAARAVLEGVADQVHERENTGYDIGGYGAALELLGADVGYCDELLLVNGTVFGPFRDGFDELFARMDARRLDFWGLTEHAELTPDPYRHRGTMPAHLQSYWLAIRRRMLASQAWADFWSRLPATDSYADAVRCFEVPFTSHFTAEGFVHEAAYPAAPYGVANPTMEAPLELLRDGCPAVKRRVFFHAPIELDHRGVAVSEVFDEMVEREFPAEVVVESLAPRVPPRTLSLATRPALVLRPPIRSLAQEPSRDPDGDVIVAGAFRVRRVEGSVWPWLARDPEGLLHGVDLVVQRGRHPAMITSSRLTTRARRDAEQALWEDAQPIAWEFADHPLIGAAFPLQPQLGTELAGNGWQGRYGREADLAAILGLEGPLDRPGPMAPYAAVAAYRVEALRPIVDVFRANGGWDALAERIEGGGEELERRLDLLASRIVAQAGYTTVEVGTATQIAAAYARIDERLQTAMAMLPHGTSAPYQFLQANRNGRFSGPALADALVRRYPGAGRAFRIVRAWLRNARAWLRNARPRAAAHTSTEDR
ncbi:rhamnosyltransferase [Pseudoclavibacter chungangensis]|uniref:rhamnan synthesis F family protein n=1 Tax=Pseudoclavibacter chungangensis TaxID=587635 RepID=UPI0015CC76EA|nr:rhamnan synthesis F family protein [Pseudoclavibacter chungangensis]NYJ67669.1 rhamnosyltransferase [Pseudoclavibacter chungangensis]